MTLYLADTSAWHRSTHTEIAAAWESRLADDSLTTCTQVRLEILNSARNLSAYEELGSELQALHQLPCGTRQFDLIIAACAETGEAVMWHYDEDYDRIAAITGQATEWIARRGTL